VPNLEEKVFIQVECGGMHTVALTNDGKVFTWGVNDEGCLGRPTSGNAWLGSKQHLEDSNYPGLARMPDGVHVVQVAAGDGFTFALAQDGCIYGWGCFKDDTSGNAAFSRTTEVQKLPVLVYSPETGRDGVKKIVAGSRHMMALTKRGEVLTWGIGNRGQLGRIASFGQGSDHDFLQDLEPAAVNGISSILDASSIVDVACGANTCFVIRKDGEVAGWGLNNVGQLSVPNEGDPAENVIWKPVLLENLEDVAAVAGGENHTLVLTKHGQVLAFGGSGYGPLGRTGVPTDDKESGNASFPVPAPVEAPEDLAGETVISIAAGPNVSGCITKEGNLYLWGQGTNHQLAKGDTEEDGIVPERVRRTKQLGMRSIRQLSFGGLHAALLANRQEDLQPAVAAAGPAPVANGAGPSGAN
jgi:regulator of chromosome condensation